MRTCCWLCVVAALLVAAADLRGAEPATDAARLIRERAAKEAAQRAERQAARRQRPGVTTGGFAGAKVLAPPQQAGVVPANARRAVPQDEGFLFCGNGLSLNGGSGPRR